MSINLEFSRCFRIIIDFSITLVNILERIKLQFIESHPQNENALTFECIYKNREGKFISR
ncbi:MAG: hypothetical protein CEE43_02280 [Promethearchaeota archaeon Loki_b32]|nr:MAG: hypothetical protein CEE43_02280 [Candidatus Lokiarchaeota archaeon Loki_b32]